MNIRAGESLDDMEAVHEHWMRQAIAEAHKAEALGEVPIGAIVVRHGEIIGRGYNLRETTMDSTAHAEMVAIREGQQIHEFVATAGLPALCYFRALSDVCWGDCAIKGTPHCIWHSRS